MPVSIREVAIKAGVTHGTVSKVLGGNPKYSIPLGTRQRILTAVDELGYRPNHAAQALKRGRTDIYGFYAGSRNFSIPNAFIANVVDGLRAGSNEREKDLLLVGTFRGTDPAGVYGALAGGKIDGLVIFVYEDDPLAGALVSAPLPVIAVVDPVLNIPTVALDEELGARLIAEHLAVGGHKRVLYCRAYGAMTSTVERKAAFVREAAARGMRVTEYRDTLVSGGFDEFDTFWNVSRNQRPTAAVAWNDTAAIALLTHCLQVGINVPGDLAIVGFDGLSPNPSPSLILSTVLAPWREVAREAVHMLARRIAGEDVPMLTRLPVAFRRGTTS